MDKQRIESYKRRLLQEREELIGLVARVEQDGRFADEEGTQDLADRAANSYAKEFLFHQSSNERTLLQLIEEALGRIEQGSYGACAQCGDAMDNRRLEAVPWARHCVSCQEKQDQGLL